MARHISGERKTAYYLGMGLMILGGILFASTFVTFATRFGDFSNFESNAKSEMFRAFGGMALLIVGGIIRGIGARGLAGSGVVLDPEKARQELEPYSRMAGGMVKDALDEADVNLGGPPEKVVMIKCPSCGRLNEENSKFCQECGKAIL
ncbi:MAG: zinc ribbon domain-containing protein [Planctomycetia bacterium]|nr:zinc ribbon domain-containing protein [Planctomycetia bacterium]